MFCVRICTKTVEKCCLPDCRSIIFEYIWAIFYVAQLKRTEMHEWSIEGITYWFTCCKSMDK